MSSRRNIIPGVVLRPEVFKISNSALTWFATKYTIYEDRARQKLLFTDTFTGNSKEAFAFNKEITDDRVVFFTTDIQLSDGSWCGESPLTPVVLRKSRVSSSGIIITPEVAVTIINNEIVIRGSEYIRYEGDAVHTDTDYIIEDDVTGEVKYSRVKDRENLTGITISNLSLDSNRIYRVKVRYEDVLGKYSNYGSCLLITGDILDILVPSDNIRIPYGDSLLLENDSNVVYLLDSELLSMDIYRYGSIINTIKYDKGFLINSMDYKLGDVLKGIIKYGNSTKVVEIIISAKNTEEDVDPDFVMNGLYKNLNASTFLLSGVSTSKQNKDGYIYDIDYINKKLVRIEYDDVLSKISKKDDVIDLSSIITDTMPYRAVYNNPYGGLIVILSGSNGDNNINDLTNPAILQKILFINTTSYTVEKTLTIDMNGFGPTYNDNSFIDGDNLIIYNRSYYDFRNIIRVFGINLVTKSLTEYKDLKLDGSILRGYTPIKHKNQILLVKLGVDEVESIYKHIQHMQSSNSGSNGGWNIGVYYPIIDDEMVYTMGVIGGVYQLLKTNIKTSKTVSLVQTGFVSNSYNGCRRSPVNGNLYYTPSTAANIMVVNPKDDTISYITHASITSAVGKWGLGCMGSNGKMYSAPSSTLKSILITDTITNIPSFIAITSSAIDAMCAGAVEADGFIYFAPLQENRIIALNMATNALTYHAVTGLALNTQAFRDGYYDEENRNIYFTPHKSTSILMMNIDTKVTTLIPIPGAGAVSYNRHVGIGRYDDTHIYFGAGTDKKIRILDTTNNTISTTIDMPIASGVYSCSHLIEKSKMFITGYINGSSDSGWINTFLPDANNPKVLENINGSVVEHATIPNPINVTNGPTLGRLVKLKNSKPAIVYAPSPANSKSGVIEIDGDSFELTDKRANLTATVDQRIVYTLSDGRIITANNDKAVLFY